MTTKNTQKTQTTQNLWKTLMLWNTLKMILIIHLNSCIRTYEIKHYYVCIEDNQ